MGSTSRLGLEESPERETDGPEPYDPGAGIESKHDIRRGVMVRGRDAIENREHVIATINTWIDYGWDLRSVDVHGDKCVVLQFGLKSTVKWPTSDQVG